MWLFSSAAVSMLRVRSPRNDPIVVVLGIAGAMLFRHSEQVQHLLDAWTAEQYAGNQKYDQDALNKVTVLHIVRQHQ